MLAVVQVPPFVNTYVEGAGSAGSIVGGVKIYVKPPATALPVAVITPVVSVIATLAKLVCRCWCCNT